MMHTRHAVAALLTVSIAVAARAQDQPVAPRGQYVGHAFDTTWLPNEADQSQVVYADIVREAGAAWMRLHFAIASVPSGGSVRMTSLLDGEVQQLDAAGLSMWSNTSAYFNGDSVLVELIAAPHSRSNRLSVAMLEIEMRDEGALAGTPGQCGICGADDRTTSTQPWVARLMSVGCTASVYTSCSCMVTAGHCSGGTVMQFNVPPSTAGCALVNPPVADQFPVVNKLFASSGVGADWCVMTMGTNSLGQKPVQRYGAYRPLASSASSTFLPVGSALDVWGYGVDATCTLSQTQQRSTGAITAVLASSLQFNDDIRGGNSGSSMHRNGELFGIVTHCQVNCPNHGTRIDLAAFAAARASLCACSCNADVAPTGVVDVNDLLAVISTWGPCPAVPAPCLADIAPAPSGNGVVDVNDLLAVISTWGPCPF
ncbi:MAG TPA: trypsin-like serine protease [Phycisphaerales bacterium]|nr:trypsin-like serine protease [Phycisphaerales bacterium]